MTSKRGSLGLTCAAPDGYSAALYSRLVANGMTVAEIIDVYPYLEPEDIHQALHYVAWLAEESVYPLEPVQP